ncbi:MAG: hypothetical protein AAF787_15660 [Chloroflexota bacterium]
MYRRRSLRRKKKGRKSQQETFSPEGSDSTTRTVQNLPQNVEQLTPDMAMQLQRTLGNHATERLLRDRYTQPTPSTSKQPIQRMLMPLDRWKSESSRFGKMRSVELIEIDQALLTYNMAGKESPASQIQKLNALQNKIETWKATKKDGKSSRMASVDKLAGMVANEQKTLAEQNKAQPQADSPNVVQTHAPQVFQSAAKETRSALSTQTKGQGEGFVKQMGPYVEKATALQESATKNMGTRTGARSNNALVTAHATESAVRALNSIGLAYINKSRPEQEKAENHILEVITSVGDLYADESEQDKQAESDFNNILTEMTATLTDYNSVVESKLGTAKPEEADTDLLEGFGDVVDTGTTIGGYFGTGGKGNEGFNEFYKPQKTGEDGKPEQESGLKKDVRETFDVFGTLDPEKQANFAKLAELEKQEKAGVPLSEEDEKFKEKWEGIKQSDSDKQNAISGGMDMANATMGTVTDTVGFMQAMAVLKDPEASDHDKLQAKLTLAKAPAQFIDKYGKMTGGMLTAMKQGDTQLPESSFKSFQKDNGGADGVDISTDFKLVGDFGGWFASAIDSIKSLIDSFHYMFGEKDEKTKSDDTRKRLEFMGNSLSKLANTGKSITGNVKSMGKLVQQIDGGGQAKAGTTAFMGPHVMPALGLVTGTMDAIRNGYKLVRIGIRRSILTKKLTEMTSSENAQNTSYDDATALEFAHGSLVKRSNRIGINLGHALASIVASGFDLSGIGTAPGMVIKLSSGAMKLGQIGLRKGKQYARDKKAEKRADKDAERIAQGLRDRPESFEEFQLRKKKEYAAKGRVASAAMAVHLYFKPNWDKSTDKKAQDNRSVAMQIYEMEEHSNPQESAVYEALGIQSAMQKLEEDRSTYKEKIDTIENALKKRD